MSAVAPPTTAATHHAILSGIVRDGHAPSFAELAAAFHTDELVMVSALRALERDHGVVLHPHRPEVWVAHPFATAPTAFTVHVGERMWWGTCAWCSLGIAALLGGDGPVEIRTTLGAEGRQPVTLRVVDGHLEDDRFVVHFPIPMSRAWDNVVHTCQVMLLFRDAAGVDGWCARHGVARGDVRDAATVLAFAGEWYGRHLDADWRKWTAVEAAAIFARHGLDGPIWDLDASTERF